MLLKRVISGLITLLIVACRPTEAPKPYGYFRIQLPEQSYITVSDNKPFAFELPVSARLVNRTFPHEAYWFDIEYPGLNAAIHVSYKPVKSNLAELSEDARKFVYKHSIQADDISEQVFVNQQNQVYGILYEIRGNTASNIQFVLTDSVRHFVRGALYFDNEPNKDSIAPVTNFIRTDIRRFIETFSWK